MIHICNYHSNNNDTLYIYIICIFYKHHGDVALGCRMGDKTGEGLACQSRLDWMHQCLVVVSRQQVTMSCQPFMHWTWILGTIQQVEKDKLRSIIWSSPSLIPFHRCSCVFKRFNFNFQTLARWAHEPWVTKSRSLTCMQSKVHLE